MKKCVQTFDQECTQVNEPCVFCVHEHRVGVHHETASNRGLYIVSPTMGSRMDELAVMSRWQAQRSSQVTAAHCDKFMTSACLSLSHTHSDTHAHARTNTHILWHALWMRLWSYLRHCSDKPSVCVCVATPAFSSVGKRTNGLWRQLSVKRSSLAGNVCRTMTKVHLMRNWPLCECHQRRPLIYKNLMSQPAF